MPEPIAYLNRQLIPASQAAISVFDTGFMLGATVTEVLRTFGGELFRLPEHMARLKHSLEIAGLGPEESVEEIAEISARVVRHNFSIIDAADDVSLCVFVTPGIAAATMGESLGTATVGIHTSALQFDAWAESYEAGASVVTTSVRQVPEDCWPAALKCRSRMHYYLADREAKQIDPRSRALLLDHEGYVREATTANIVAYFQKEGLVSPPIADVLPGISLQVVSEFAGRFGIAFRQRKIWPEELARADEAFLTTTPNCILPVTRFNGKPIGNGQPGNVFRDLLAAWNEMVGFDIAQQARRFARRR